MSKFQRWPSSKDKYTGLFVEFSQQWSQFFQFSNWYTFNLINIEFEHEPIFGGTEFTFVLFGFGIRIRYNYEETEEVKDIMERVDRINKEEDPF